MLPDACLVHRGRKDSHVKIRGYSVDFRALPIVGRGRHDLETPFAFPRTPTENRLVKIWAEILDVEQVGIHDRFLELGCESLLANRIICRIIDVFRIEMPLATLFESPTVADMAVVLEQHLAKRHAPEEIGRILAQVEGLSETEAHQLVSERSSADTANDPES